MGLGDLPVSVTVERARPYTYTTERISIAKAEELAYYQLRAVMESELLPDTQLLKKSIYTEAGEESYLLRCTVVCIEDIAKISEFEIK